MNTELKELYAKVDTIMGNSRIYPFDTLVDFDEHLQAALNWNNNLDYSGIAKHDELMIRLAYWHPSRGVMAGLSGSFPIHEKFCGKTVEEQFPSEDRLSHKIEALKEFLSLYEQYQASKEPR